MLLINYKVHQHQLYIYLIYIYGKEEFDKLPYDDSITKELKEDGWKKIKYLDYPETTFSSLDSSFIGNGNLGNRYTYPSEKWSVEYDYDKFTEFLFIKKDTRKIKKIKLLGLSGTTCDNARIREFEFGGLKGWGSGNRKSGSYLTTVSTNFTTTPSNINTNEWVSGGKLTSAGDANDNSLYLSGTQDVINKWFLFEFGGNATLPSINDLSYLRIYWDNADINTGDDEEGTFNFLYKR